MHSKCRAKNVQEILLLEGKIKRYLWNLQKLLKLVLWVLMMIFMINLSISTVFYMKKYFWTKFFQNGHCDVEGAPVGRDHSIAILLTRLNLSTNNMGHMCNIWNKSGQLFATHSLTDLYPPTLTNEKQKLHTYVCNKQENCLRFIYSKNYLVHDFCH